MPTAYTRLFVPEKPDAPVTSSSYLRLGSYSVGEKDIVTGLTASSENSVRHESDHAGILVFTNKDYHATVEGATLMKIGGGHTTEIGNGDAKYTVSKGSYELSAKNGVSISAGISGTPGNINITGSDYKQTATGNLSEITLGNSKRATHGTTMEFYMGAKVTCLMGASVTAALGLNVAAFLGVALSVKLDYDLSISSCGSSMIRFLFANTLTVGNEFNNVTGNLTRTIGGYNVQVADSDVRYVKKIYLKVVDDADVKRVRLDGTWCETSVQVADAQVESGELSTDQRRVVSKVRDLETETGKFKAKTWSSVLFL
ncbi:hypothetical protein [Bradyrhizobium sp. Ai1a-2]|uniref:hypothetical protein n=1 Tax=Bradyrhizobium sp. Ai1a-2 TaxID=196490 RepID=UPI00041E5D23|nr:hypothetical protein [Bradyrhizobium sp. Ai1a-2]